VETYPIPGAKKPESDAVNNNDPNGHYGVVQSL